MRKLIFILLFQIMFSHLSLANEVLGDILLSIPSPIEILHILQKQKIPYSSESLHFARRNHLLYSDFEGSLQLGMAFVDLEYALLNNDQSTTNQIIIHIRDLIKSYPIVQTNHFKIEDLKTDTQHIQATLLQNRIWFEKLKMRDDSEKNASFVNAYLLGAWLETNYLLSLAVGDLNDDILNEILAEQKINLDQMLLCLSFWEEKPIFQFWISKLNDLQTLYENVKISFSNIQSDSTVSILENTILVQNQILSTCTYTSQNLKEIKNLFVTTSDSFFLHPIHRWKIEIYWGLIIFLFFSIIWFLRKINN